MTRHFDDSGAVFIHTEKARALIEIANSFRDGPEPDRKKSFALYTEAETWIRPICRAEDCPFRDDLAAIWTNRGIAWMAEDQPESTEESLACFHQAIILRQTLLGSGNSWFRYNLAGVWMNRAQALSRSKNGSHRSSVISSCNAAVEILQALPCEGCPLFAGRQALAHLNRGAALLNAGGSSNLREAVRAFDWILNTRIFLGPGFFLQASAASNKAEALNKLGLRDEARGAARQSMLLVSATELEHRDAAYISIKARLALCASSAHLLFRSRRSNRLTNSIAEALDAAEMGLNIGRKWARDAQFLPVVQELYRFCAQAYALRQPHFLTEFLAEFGSEVGSDSFPGSRWIAKDALNTAMGTVATDGFTSLGRPANEQALATFRELRETAAQLI